MKTKKREGISLIVLVLTIIVIVILATAVILSIANNNPIENAKKAKFLNDIKTFEEDYALRTLNSYFEPDDEVEITIDDLTDNEEYRKKLKILDDKIVLKESAATEQEIKWAKEAGIKVLGSTYLKERESSDYAIFFGIEHVSKITKIIFEDTTKNAPSGAVDMSAAEDQSIIGWLDGTEVHIASDGIICAPEDSSHLFSYLHNLTEIKNIELLDTSNVINMSRMFVQSGAKGGSLDLSSFNTEKVTDISNMFEEGGFSSINLSNWDNSNLVNVKSMVYMCYNLTNLDLTNFGTSNITDMSRMFDYCNSLTSLDLSSFDTEKVTDMSSMFSSCSSLISLNLSSFNVQNVINMNSMFQGCNKLTSLDLSSFDLSNVTSMSAMFALCRSLTKIEVGNTFNLNKEASSDNMFYDCSSLVGGNGTVYNESYIDASYARVDTVSTPGYFTLKSK